MPHFQKLFTWLHVTISTNPDRRYNHKLIRETIYGRQDAMCELRAYYHRAHEDARRRLRRIAGIPLDPIDEPESDPADGYPGCCDLTTLQGYFGEVFAAVIAENYSPFGINGWRVPAFLFRFHIVLFQHLELEWQIENPPEHVFGRTGDDCVAFTLDENGVITRILFCESKCTLDHDAALVSAAHKKLCRDERIPVDTMQLIDVLLDSDEEDAELWIRALRDLRTRRRTTPPPRYDLVCYVCGRDPAVATRSAWLPIHEPHPSYTATRPLEAVEVHLNQVEALIDEVYARN